MLSVALFQSVGGDTRGTIATDIPRQRSTTPTLPWTPEARGKAGPAVMYPDGSGSEVVVPRQLYMEPPMTPPHRPDASPIASTTEVKGINQRKLMGSFQETANRICSMTVDMEDLQTELERSRRTEAAMTAQLADSAAVIRAMEVKAIDEDIRKNSLILERDSALASLRQLQGRSGERLDSVEALANMAIEVQQRDADFVQLKLEKDLQQQALNETTRELAETRSELSMARKTLADGEQLQRQVFDWNKQLVEKLSLKDCELQKALTTVELMVAEHSQLQDEMGRTAERSCEAIEKMNAAEHRFAMTSRLHALELSRIEVESHSRHSALQGEYFNSLAELDDLRDCVAAKDAADAENAAVASFESATPRSEEPVSILTEAPGGAAASPSRRNSPASVPYSPLTPPRPAFAVATTVDMPGIAKTRDGKIAASLVRWQLLRGCDADARPDSVFDVADELITMLCEKTNGGKIGGRRGSVVPVEPLPTPTPIPRLSPEITKKNAFGDFLTRMSRWIQPEGKCSAEEEGEATPLATPATDADDAVATPDIVATAAAVAAVAVLTAELSLQAACATLANPAMLLAQNDRTWSDKELSALIALKGRVRAREALRTLSGVMSTTSSNTREEELREETVRRSNESVFSNLVKVVPGPVNE